MLRYSLVSDGPSDRVLVPLLTWLLRDIGVNISIQAQHADMRHLPRPPRSLSDRIATAVDLYPCDLLFVHRDAEREDLEHRRIEIRAAVAEARRQGAISSVVCVIPVRMQEAWLLIDEEAIRHAAGNRYGRMPLNMPRISGLETIPDPKAELYSLLRQASGLQGRRLDSFRVSASAYRVADGITDYAPLRSLTAFRELEEELRTTLGELGLVGLAH